MKFIVVGLESDPAVEVTVTVPEPVVGGFWVLLSEQPTMVIHNARIATDVRIEPDLDLTTGGTGNHRELRFWETLLPLIVKMPRIPSASAIETRTGDPEFSCAVAAWLLVEIVSVELPEVLPAAVLVGFSEHVTPVIDVCTVHA